MDYCETNQGAKVKLLLTHDELGITAIDDLCDKFLEFIEVTKEASSGRKTRSANKKADDLYDQIISYKLPPVRVKQHISNDSPVLNNNNTEIKYNNGNIQNGNHLNGTNGYSSKTRSTNSSGNSSQSESSSSRPVTRSLRHRSRTPEVKQKRHISPATPTQQRLRANINSKPPSSNSSGTGDQTSVLTAALNQQHPTVSVTKIRQLLRADSVQKKKIRDDEDKERRERLRLDRKAKEERAESQKKQLLEERAVNAKLNRELRLQHAAEVRKAREEAKLQQKLKEEIKNQKATKEETKSTKSSQQQCPATKPAEALTKQKSRDEPEEELKEEPKEEPIIKSTTNQKKSHDKHLNNKQKDVTETKEVSPPKPPKKLNETFQKPVDEINNIEIVIQDDSNVEDNKVIQIASWTKAPHFREALIKQFSKPNFHEYLNRFQRIAPPLMLPVDLKEILGTKSLGTRALVRTSSAVWSPVHKPLKRTSSMVSTPNDNSKR